MLDESENRISVRVADIGDESIYLATGPSRSYILQLKPEVAENVYEKLRPRVPRLLCPICYPDDVADTERSNTISPLEPI